MTGPFSETGVLGPSGILAAAPILGFVFGWFLERGGLGSARKLTGQFYFTDFTVFKVLFSALLTAMLGVFWLDHLGLLRLDLVYLPETFLWPQAVGGVLFGAGLVAGGLCPGTSCVAAAAGRMDGIAVIAGMLTGIMIFNGAYDSIAEFYTSGALGPVTLADVFGTSRGIVIGILTAVAMAGFAVASRIERWRS